MTQRGFIALPLMWWGAIAAGAVILGLSIAVKVQTARFDASQQELATERGHFAVFKETTRKAGEAQEAKNRETIRRQEKSHATALISLQSRYSDLDARYARLRKPATGNPGSGGLPQIPDTARPADDAARNQRLLEVLRAADGQTAQLIELQQWVREQGR